MTQVELETNVTVRSQVLLIDDHPIVLQGLSNLINASDDLHVCGQAASGREALEILDSCAADVAIVDISLGDRNGVELIKEIQSKRPDLPCLALSMYDETMYAMRVLRAGGRGYIMKDEVSKNVLGAIRQVLTGNVYLSERMTRRLVEQMGDSASASSSPAPDLSDRELEILTLIGRGQSSREIAENLGLSPKTIDAHRERIKHKLQLTSVTELVRYAVRFTLDGRN